MTLLEWILLCGVSVEGTGKRRFLGGVGAGFLTTLGVGARFFCPTPKVQVDHFFRSHS